MMLWILLIFAILYILRNTKEYYYTITGQDGKQKRVQIIDGKGIQVVE
jgi:hypothetical protein